MANKREIDTILEGIEEDYTHDLSMHLYSTFLLHKVNFLFPKKKWSSWPLPFNVVPDPKPHQRYTDLSDPFTPITTTPTTTRTRTLHGAKVTENVSSGDETLKFELKALIEKKIYEKIHKRISSVTNSTSFLPPVELNESVVDGLVDKMKVNIDETVEQIFQARLDSGRRKNEIRLMNWQDILFAKLNADIENGVSIDVTWYRLLYLKIHKIFSLNYKYEKDEEPQENTREEQEEEGEEEEEENDDEEDELVRADKDEDERKNEEIQEKYDGYKVFKVPLESIDSSSFSTFEELVQDIDVKRRKLSGREFDMYKDFQDWSMVRQQQISNGNNKKMSIFLKLLEIEERKQVIAWESKFDILNSKKYLFRKIPNGLKLDKKEERAIQMSGMALDQDSFIV